MTRTSSLARRAAPALVALLSASALAACGSSTTATTSPSVSPSTSMSTTMSSTPDASGGGNVGLCTGFNKVDLATLESTHDPASTMQAWTQLSADAPDEIKADMQVVGTFLQAAVAHDYTKIQTEMSQLPPALTHIETYIAANCHG